MRIAAITYVYNECVNLPIWRKYYGSAFGEKNLYIVDRESDDGSTTDLGDANKISIPHTDFDDIRKSTMLSLLHSSLLQDFDVVVVTDCDEIVVADPAIYQNLAHYIEEKKPSVINCIGLNLRHVLTAEAPLDLDYPILSQRKIASFERAACKPLISSIPTKWEAGGHVCNSPPLFDSNLFMFHLKYMDYSIAMRRQQINRATAWSARAIGANHGVHHRYDYEQFVNEGFLDPINALRSGKVGSFVFDKEVSALIAGSSSPHGFHLLGQAARTYVEIPERFSHVF